MADRRHHVASLLIGVVVWTCENDSKTISVDANPFENGAEQLRFGLKTNYCGRGLNKEFRTNGVSLRVEPGISFRYRKYPRTNSFFNVMFFRPENEIQTVLNLFGGFYFIIFLILLMF